MDRSSVNRSPLNTSKSKQMYTFSKAKRWVDVKDSVCTPIYQLPTTLSKRAAGIGYGKKMNITQDNNTPAPNFYTVQRSQEHGRTMALGRDHANKYESIFLGLIQNTPGPGTYKFRDSISSVRYSMRQRVSSRKDIERKPGPGHYNLPSSINSTGVYALSQYRNSGAIVLSPPKSHSERKARETTPGPGAYREIGNFDPMGTYFCSKFSASKCNKFPRAQRTMSEYRDRSPGPGSYKLPSEFGF
ncbi:unnamed protein product (macronuclear) [Paramecium tetraurelia]|uniref:Uncharacterized protein n=1 Tax=Paramecium tetraurelia TaxID=5888 RepID=A0BW65_PARTE|nr:uncharacterized protein GSPATT00032634001 [Paramecium tetraurelia]CAK62782.1 unnamed protein product [Paramecium tetraurelia]|eukprot:XP_001430180.1 hypothetical protein (macronuclear) [Paramecium tetraurelia strain d4-2]